jgi:hypothetical protein
MMSWPDLVRHWHDLMTLDGMRDKPGQPTQASEALGWRILQEEWEELYRSTCDTAHTPERLAEVVKELCDLIWTAMVAQAKVQPEREDKLHAIERAAEMAATLSKALRALAEEVGDGD